MLTYELFVIIVPLSLENTFVLHIYPNNIDKKDRLNSGKNSDDHSSFEHCPLSHDLPINDGRFIQNLKRHKNPHGLQQKEVGVWLD